MANSSLESQAMVTICQVIMGSFPRIMVCFQSFLIYFGVELSLVLVYLAFQKGSM